ncbi:(d)CMP kinase [Schleiferiaceae bacterium]|jgi:CMP/dCMP kinase|nr:(d)CMP kinase [Schleiferiaceae bacterium]MDC3353522.1 (d)CMP kinase [Schleiferiaceae bacterium]
MIIAIDGFSSTGKSTVAKRLATALDFIYVDTGAMYRMVALTAVRNGLVKDGVLHESALLDLLPGLTLGFSRGEHGENLAVLNGEIVEADIRSMEINRIVSRVSSIPAVRRQLVAQQQRMGLGQSLVMDGRDIGTVVFPHAELKIFMTADADIRAGRRLEELRAKGDHLVSLQEVKSNLLQRDAEDQARLDSPLLKASDARELDNSHISPDEVFQTAWNWAKEKM